MTFKPMKDRLIVEDEISGVRVRVGSASGNIDSLRVKAEGLHESPLQFTIARYPNSYSSGDGKKGLEIQVIPVSMMFNSARLHDFQQNTAILRTMIEGICEFNRNWPLTNSRILTSDLEEVRKKSPGVSLSFSIPSNDELIALSR